MQLHWIKTASTSMPEDGEPVLGLWKNGTWERTRYTPQRGWCDERGGRLCVPVWWARVNTGMIAVHDEDENTKDIPHFDRVHEVIDPNVPGQVTTPQFTPDTVMTVGSRGEIAATHGLTLPELEALCDATNRAVVEARARRDAVRARIRNRTLDIAFLEDLANRLDAGTVPPAALMAPNNLRAIVKRLYAEPIEVKG